jgi:hypothetical protein
LLALGLSAVGVLLLVEAASRKAAAHPIPLYVLGGGLLLAGLAIGVVPGHGRAVRRLTPLRAIFMPTASPDFSVAFERDIGLPAPSVGWDQLHASGGTDIGYSNFRFTFSNRSSVPLSISDIHAQVLSGLPAPTGSEASVFTQGDQPVESFLVRLDSAAPASTAAVYRTNADGAVQRDAFFQRHVISLQPGEIYQGMMTVRADVSGAVRYRFVVAGQTPSASFRTTIPDVYAISGRRPTWKGYGHHYWTLDECKQSVGHLWVRVDTYAQYLGDPYPGCPGAAWTRAGSR